MKRTELQKLARLRIKEAKILLDSNNFSGAYYLAGYSIECALKACVAKQIHKFEIPGKNFISDFYVHDLQKLVKLAGLETNRTNFEKTDVNFALNWAIVKDWKETSRYQVFTQIQAKELYASITSRNGGVLKWLRIYW